jgi:Ternary complex associated domain 7
VINAVALESAMTAQAVLSRLARHGFWLDPNQPQAAEWIRQCATRTGLPGDETARRLAKDSSTVAVAIRRQWFANVLWYARSVLEVLTPCSHADPTQPLLDVLNLHESDSRPAVPLEAAAGASNDSVVLDGDQAVGVGPRETSVPLATGGTTRRRGSGGPGAPPPRPDTDAVTARAWPRIDAPEYTRAGAPFEVVGASASRRKAASRAPRSRSMFRRVSSGSR